MDEELLKIIAQLLRLNQKEYVVDFDYSGTSDWFSIRIVKGHGKAPKKIFDDSIQTRRRIWCRKFLNNLTPDPFYFDHFMAYLKRLEHRHPVLTYNPLTDYGIMKGDK